MANLRRSLIINFLSSNGSTAVNFMVSIVLARMLGPKEIGVFSITVVFVNIAHIFRDFGVTSYLQREKTLNAEMIRSAMGVLYAFSWGIATILFLASGWIARFYGEPGIESVMRVLAIGFIFIPFGSVTQALLTREYAADKQAVVTAVGTVAYASSCLILAWLGFGTMSLAWANLINIIACGIAYAPFRPANAPWIPSMRGWRRVMDFGSGAILGNCANAVNNALPDLMLGKLTGAHDVGIVSRANSTVGIFGYVAGAAMNYGSLPYFASVHHRGESLTPVMSRANAYVTGIGWPALIATAVFAHEVIAVLYGDKWLESVPLVAPLAAAAAIMLAFNYTQTAIMAIGRPYLSALPALTSIAGRMALPLIFFAGTALSFANILLLATACTAPVLLLLQRKYLRFGIRDALRSLRGSAIVALACLATAIVVRFVLPEWHPFPRLLTAGVAMTTVWLITLRLVQHPLLHELSLLLQRIPLFRAKQS